MGYTPYVPYPKGMGTPPVGHSERTGSRVWRWGPMGRCHPLSCVMTPPWHLDTYQPIPLRRKAKMDRLKYLHDWMVAYRGYHTLAWALFALCAYSHFK